MDRLEKMLMLHEGVKLKPYFCTANRLTIGVGRNIDDKGITPSEAVYLMRNDIAEVQEGLARALPWFTALDEVRRSVLIDMAFNLGVKGLLSFKKTLTHIEAKRYTDASAEMLLSKWAQQVGSRARRLSTMMKTGEWP